MPSAEDFLNQPSKPQNQSAEQFLAAPSAKQSADSFLASSSPAKESTFQPVKDYKEYVGGNFKQGLRDMLSAEPTKVELGGTINAKTGIIPPKVSVDLPGSKTAKEVLGGVEAATAPMWGIPHSLVTKPLERKTGIPAAYSDLAGMLLTQGIAAAPKAIEAASRFTKSNEELAALDKTKAQVKDVFEEFNKIQGQNKADDIAFSQHLKDVSKQNIPSETFDKILEAKEGKTLDKLTPAEQKIYQEHIAPLVEEHDALVAKLQKRGYSGDQLGEAETAFKEDKDVGHIPRETKGKGGFLDRMVASEKPYPARKSLSKAASSTMPRSYFSLRDLSGNRLETVRVEDGRIYDIGKVGKSDNLVGNLEHDKKTGEMSVTRSNSGEKIGTLGQSTMKEIEDVTNTRYHRNALAVYTGRVRQLRRADRNSELLDTMKSSPEFSNIAVKEGENAPKGWRTVGDVVPQFRGYKFKPEIAEAIEDFAGNVKTSEGFANALEQTGRLVKASIFFNPVPHMKNTFNWYLFSKGLAGTVKDLPTTMKVLPKAVNEVFSQGKLYKRALREGMALPRSDTGTKQLAEGIRNAMEIDFKGNPGKASELAKAFGYVGVDGFIKALYGASNKALWSFGEIISMTRVMELQQKGLSLKEAIKETERFNPDYRVPSRVMGSRAISQTLQNPMFSMFGRYQYNRMKAYAENVKDLVSKESDPVARAAALDRLAFMGVLQSVYYPAVSRAWQQYTGNPSTSVKEPGALSIPQHMGKYLTGKEGLGQALSGTFSPGMLTSPLEVFPFNSKLISGKPVYQPEDLREGNLGRVGYDIAKFGLGQFAPIGIAQSALEGKKDLKETGLEQLDVRTPTAKQQKGAKRGQKMAKKAQTKAERERGF